MDDRTAFACQVFDHMPFRQQLVIPWIAFLLVYVRKKYCFQLVHPPCFPFYDFCFKTLILASYASI